MILNIVPRAAIASVISLVSLAWTLAAQDGPRVVSAQPATSSIRHAIVNRSGAKKSNAVPLGSSNPLFLPAVPYPTQGNWSVAAADLNGDGKPDLVIANEYADISGYGTIGVMLGNGDGTFQPEVQYHSGGVDYYGAQAVIADVNRDGKPDILVANEGENGPSGSSVGVLLGNGDGTFQTVVPYDTGGYALSIAVSDLNGDGNPDIVVGNCCDETLAVLLGNGDGTFQPAVSYPSIGTIVSSVAIADVTGDGHPDILVAGDTGFGILRGNGNGTFQPIAVTTFPSFASSSVTAADVNGDGKPDLIIGGNTCSNGSCEVGAVIVLLGNGNGTFQPAVTYNLGRLLSVAQALVADVDGDGKLDVLIANPCGQGCPGAGGLVGVLLGNGDGTFQPAVGYGSGGLNTESLAVADFNGDGKYDVVTANNESLTVGVLMNNTGPHRSTTTTLVSNVDPAVRSQTVTYTATVTNSSGKPMTRDVSFQDGSTVLATLPMTGNQASYSTYYKFNGSHPITATYSGDAENLASTSPILMEYIEQFPIPTTTILTTSGSPAFIGQPLTFTATVTWKESIAPDGEPVIFEDAGKPVATVALAGGRAVYTTSSLSAKTHIIKAIYAGDKTFKPSSGTLSQVVELYPTTTILSSTPNPSSVKQAVTFTASITSNGASLPPGKVMFKDGTKSIGTIVLSGGVATLTKSTMATGSHAITAEYEGDAASAKSTSAILTQVVN